MTTRGESLDRITPGGQYASPILEDLRQDKDLRNSFLNAIALSFLVALGAGLYYVYSILEPFIVPLAWALLTGVLLHPYKRKLTNGLRKDLEKIQKNDQNVGVTILKNTIKFSENLLDFVGKYFLSKWRLIVWTVLVGVGSYVVYIYTPQYWVLAFLTFRDWFFVTIPQFFDSVKRVHLYISSTLFVSALLIIPEYKVFCMVMSCITWLMAGSLALSYIWPPLMYLLTVAVIAGYFTSESCSNAQTSDIREGDEMDGAETNKVQSFVLYILNKLTILKNAPDEIDSKQIDDTQLPSQGPKASTPLPVKTSVAAQAHVNAGDTPRPGLATPKQDFKIPHPGVSALKKEHGILSNRPNISEIAGGKNLGSNTPRSRLGRSFRYAKRKSSLAEMKHDSMRYIYMVVWCCILIQLWIHPALLVLLPFCILYSCIKRALQYVFTTELVQEYGRNVYKILYNWYSSNCDAIFPYPVRLITELLYNIERLILKITICHADNIVTVFLILGIVLVTIFAGVFISIQVYAESAYIIQSVTSIASSLDMKDSIVLNTLNISLPDNSSMEGVVDEAFTYGRNWISTTLRDTLEGTNPAVMEELEEKVLELWDRSYQYWILKQDPSIGPKISSSAITSSFGEILETVYHSRDVFNLTSMEIFVRNNMGTLTSILEHVWSLFQGNMLILVDAVLGLVRVLLHSSSGVINFLFGIIIYLTALFYLLSNSAHTYKPIEFLGQYNFFNGPGVGTVLQNAVNSVLFITVKMSTFYLLWTYLTHTVAQATIVVLPMLFSSFLAAVPVTGQYLVSLPASLEVWLLQDRPIAAVLLMLLQVAPSWLVDAAIYSEMKGGIHPWFTGLAVVGGVYVFGVVGAVYGPLVLCVLYVVVTLYSTYIQDLEPATPVGHAKSFRTPHNPSEIY